ncbi:hypothetical protein C7446_2573 [Kushneria sinocarnis]|uniref:Minor tail protein gp31 C-terminal domain-containing protein n=1 Tax=Kushneria sinocarnis TaxID=595502 RepID=A0A420WUP0_9GAMM|nr:hypothetical protein [Kushneria sinocarnis]RKQ97153.1 hypothetical protein C7446_2573 [Kushneria sinocarnis]
MRLQGTLYNAGGPISAVPLHFVSETTTQGGVLVKSEYQVKTDQDGSYDIELRPGSYRVTWGKGSQAARLGTITADESSSMTLPAALESTGGDVQEDPPSITVANSQALEGHPASDFLLVTDAGSAARSDASEFATSEQGDRADSALQARSLTQEEYDALESPDSGVLYCIPE